MADKKISALTDGTTPATTDILPAARSGGTTVGLTWAELKAAAPGAEIHYKAITSPVNVASTTEATGTTIITADATTFDGAAVIAEFYTPTAITPAPASSYMVISLFESTTQIGRFTYIQAPGATGNVNQTGVPVLARIRFTPSAAAHTYTVTAHVSATTGTPSIQAGAIGPASGSPAYIRFTKV